MKRNSLVVLGLSAVLGFGLLGIGCSDDSKPGKTDGSTDAKSDATGDVKGAGGVVASGGTIGSGGAIGSGGTPDGGGGSSTGGVTGTGGTPSTGGAGGSTVVLDGGHDTISPDLKGIDGNIVDGADAPINNDLPPVVVDGGVDAPDTSITPVDTGIDMGAVDSQGIDGSIDGGID